VIGQAATSSGATPRSRGMARCESCAKHQPLNRDHQRRRRASAVAPDPTLASTSVDGDVLFGNLANGSFTVTASKAPFSCSALTFTIQDGIGLYVASPPRATQGTNDSPPGEP